jgi:hypothetical protein
LVSGTIALISAMPMIGTLIRKTEPTRSARATHRRRPAEDDADANRTGPDADRPAALLRWEDVLDDR